MRHIYTLIHVIYLSGWPIDLDGSGACILASALSRGQHPPAFAASNSNEGWCPGPNQERPQHKDLDRWGEGSKLGIELHVFKLSL